ncbi:MAG: lytic transglycosylase domain-containing protein [Advenella sp.]|uniref:lytic transglycosylase domain-containing protein n=1 Tax=Advenella sp. TaxID=1872388 RepID=UPI003F95A995
MKMTVNPQIASWEGFYADRTERLEASTDPATRAHFEAELELARITMNALGIQPPADNHASHNSTADSQANDDDDWEKFPVNKSPVSESSGAPGSDQDLPVNTTPGATELSLGLNDALLPYHDDILAASKATGVPANLLAAVIWDESKGIASAGTVNGENGLSDSGLMQVNPATYAALKEQYPELLGADVSDAKNNIMAGALYLKDNYDQFGSWNLALRAYNSGPLSVDPSDHMISTTGFGTQNYVEKVNFYWDSLNQDVPMPDGYPDGNRLY